MSTVTGLVEVTPGDYANSWFKAIFQVGNYVYYCGTLLNPAVPAFECNDATLTYTDTTGISGSQPFTSKFGATSFSVVFDNGVTITGQLSDPIIPAVDVKASGSWYSYPQVTATGVLEVSKDGTAISGSFAIGNRLYTCNGLLASPVAVFECSTATITYSQVVELEGTRMFEAHFGPDNFLIKFVNAVSISGDLPKSISPPVTSSRTTVKWTYGPRPYTATGTFRILGNGTKFFANFAIGADYYGATGTFDSPVPTFYSKNATVKFLEMADLYGTTTFSSDFGSEKYSVTFGNGVTVKGPLDPEIPAAKVDGTVFWRKN